MTAAVGRRSTGHGMAPALRGGALSLVAALVLSCSAEGNPAPTALEGELDVFVTDSSERIHELRDDSGRRFALEFGQQPPMLATGDRVRVEGEVLEGDRFAVDTITVEDDGSVEDGVGVSAQSLIGNAVARKSKLAVLLVHWSQPDMLTVEQMRERVFTGERSTAAFYKENSYGLFELTGDVFGWYQLSGITGCNSNAIASAARAAATAAGVSLTGYQQVLYYFPRNTACRYSGLALLGRPNRPARDTWYNGSSGCVVLAQELLHNFGAVHSHSWNCTTEIGGTCMDSEYGDPYDPMGGGCYHTNAYQKAAQGWFGRCNVITVSSSETFKIAPAEKPSNDVQAIRVPMSASLCPGELSSCHYWLEYRQPLGLFDGQNASSPVHKGVLVHAAGAVDFAGTGRPGAPYILDMTPGSNMRDFTDGVLGLGKTYQEPSMGVSITVDALETDGATVTIKFPNGGSGAPTCIDGNGASSGGMTTPPPMQGMCDDGEYEFEGRCYAEVLGTYDTAVADCMERGTGWKLVEINSAAENAFVARIVGTGESWLGGNDRTTEGTWVWGSGTTFWTGGPTGMASGSAFTSFEAGEPNDGNGNSDCLRMIMGGAWRDSDCAAEYPGVCESQ